MKKESAIKLFEQKQIRTHWDDEEEKWYFSVVDVVSVLTVYLFVPLMAVIKNFNIFLR